MESKNQKEFGGDDTLALEYIRQRGYCSYSSMCNVRDKKDPEPYRDMPYFTFGKEHHSRFLERKKIITLSADEENLLKKMVHALAVDPFVCKIMEGAKVEQEFDAKINGLRMYGRIDIDGVGLIADLKTTGIGNKAQFISKMDLLQVALYRRVRKVKPAWYIGSPKVAPHLPFTFDAQFLSAINVADQQLDYLTRYIKKKL